MTETLWLLAISVAIVGCAIGTVLGRLLAALWMEYGEDRWRRRRKGR